MATLVTNLYDWKTADHRGAAALTRGSHRSVRLNPSTVKPVARNHSAVAVDSFCRQPLGGRCRASERTIDSVKGIASLPPSMRPHGHRVEHYAAVMFPAPDRVTV